MDLVITPQVKGDPKYWNLNRKLLNFMKKLLSDIANIRNRIDLGNNY